MECKVVKYIREHENWVEELSALGVRVKRDHNLAILSYQPGCDFGLPIVRECRGIIVNTDTFEVCCRGFDKFFNSYEYYADKIDWSHCRVEEKIDGSIVKLWFRKSQVVLDWLTQEPQGQWCWATNSCIKASEAPVSNTPYSFLDLIQKAVNWHDIDFEKLDKNKTYIFELVSQFNQIVIKYPFTKLYHIGTRSNITGEEFKEDIGIEQPQTYEIHTLDDCLEAVKHLNYSDDVTFEGFVVVDDNWKRVKIKSPEYLSMHHIYNNGNLSKETCIELLLQKSDLLDLCEDFPQFMTRIKYYDYKLEELKYEISKYIDFVRGLYEECEKDRKAVALAIKNNKYAWAGFQALGNNLTALDIFEKTPTSKILKLIDDYEERDIYE